MGYSPSPHHERCHQAALRALMRRQAHRARRASLTVRAGRWTTICLVLAGLIVLSDSIRAMS